MRRPVVPVTAAVVALALVGLLIYGVTTKSSDTTLDDAIKQVQTPTAPGATLARPNLDGGGSTTLASLRGQIVVLNFWASWCEPCRAEAPILERAQRRLTREHAGTVLGATYNDTPDDSRAFVREYNVTYPSVRDISTKLAEQYGTIALPETFVINPQGKIVAVSRGQLSASFLSRALASQH